MWTAKSFDNWKTNQKYRKLSKLFENFWDGSELLGITENIEWTETFKERKFKCFPTSKVDLNCQTNSAVTQNKDIKLCKTSKCYWSSLADGHTQIATGETTTWKEDEDTESVCDKVI